MGSSAIKKIGKSIYVEIRGEGIFIGEIRQGYKDRVISMHPEEAHMLFEFLREIEDDLIEMIVERSYRRFGSE
jgi:hypothetical protein